MASHVTKNNVLEIKKLNHPLHNIVNSLIHLSVLFSNYFVFAKL